MKKIERPKTPNFNTKKLQHDKNTNEKKIVSKTDFVDLKKPRMEDASLDNNRIYSNILSKLEYNIFRESMEIIYKSNYMRYKVSRSTGMLSALNNIKEITEIIGERLSYTITNLS